MRRKGLLSHAPLALNEPHTKVREVPLRGIKGYWGNWRADIPRLSEYHFEPLSPPLFSSVSYCKSRNSACKSRNSAVIGCIFWERRLESAHNFQLSNSPQAIQSVNIIGGRYQ